MADKKRRWWDPVVTEADAVLAIRDVTRGLFVTAVGMVLLAPFHRTADLSFAIVMAGLAFWARQRRSMAAGILALILLPLLDLGMTLAGRLGATNTFGTNTMVGAIVPIWGWRGLQALRLINKSNSPPSSRVQSPTTGGPRGGDGVDHEQGGALSRGVAPMV